MAARPSRTRSATRSLDGCHRVSAPFRGWRQERAYERVRSEPSAWSAGPDSSPSPFGRLFVCRSSLSTGAGGHPNGGLFRQEVLNAHRLVVRAPRRLVGRTPGSFASALGTCSATRPTRPSRRTRPRPISRQAGKASRGLRHRARNRTTCAHLRSVLHHKERGHGLGLAIVAPHRGGHSDISPSAASGRGTTSGWCAIAAPSRRSFRRWV